MSPGGLVCVVSDGISEAFTPDGEQFGNERVVEILADPQSVTPQELIERTQAQIARWQAGAEPKDDQTMVIATRA